MTKVQLELFWPVNSRSLGEMQWLGEYVSSFLQFRSFLFFFLRPAFHHYSVAVHSNKLFHNFQFASQEYVQQIILSYYFFKSNKNEFITFKLLIIKIIIIWQYM